MSNSMFYSLILVFGAFFLLIAIATAWDYYVWNGGTCRRCGKPWRHFDVDSQGGRGYTDGDHTIWITYPLDRRPPTGSR